MTQEIERPESATDDVLEYLDDLRESGETNMFGATPYLMDDFDMDMQEARAALSYWMKTFGERHPKDEQS